MYVCVVCVCVLCVCVVCVCVCVRVCSLKYSHTILYDAAKLYMTHSGLHAFESRCILLMINQLLSVSLLDGDRAHEPRTQH